MRVLIVEDETAAYENLVDILIKLDPTIRIEANTESISQTVSWLQQNPLPDLIFMDINLSDGSAFTIFNRIKLETPVIFITAYDEYALEAFKVNSIDYLLKPVKVVEMERALNKFRKFSPQDFNQYITQLNRLSPAISYKDKILLPVKDKLIPVDLKNIACFYTTDKNTCIYLKDGKSYPYTKTLDQIIGTLDPTDFIRANKQFIISRDSVENITIWFDSRLLITLTIDTPERIYISKNKAAEFKAWIVHEK